MVSRANFLLFSHTVPDHLTAKSVLPYYFLMSPVTDGEAALPVDVLFKTNMFSVDTSDDDEPLCQKVLASRASACDGSRDSQKVSPSSPCQFS